MDGVSNALCGYYVNSKAGECMLLVVREACSCGCRPATAVPAAPTCFLRCCSILTPSKKGLSSGSASNCSGHEAQHDSPSVGAHRARNKTNRCRIPC